MYVLLYSANGELSSTTATPNDAFETDGYTAAQFQR